MKNVTITSINLFVAQFKIRKKALAKLLNIDQANISYYIKNDYQVIYDQTGYCEIVKTSRRFDLNELISLDKKIRIDSA